MNSHEPFAPDARVIRFPGSARARSKDHSHRRNAVTRRRHRSKPAWHVLYGMVALTILFFVVAEVESPVGGWRTLTECLATLLIIGVMALWVRANRAALAVADAIPCDGGAQENPVAYSPRQLSVLRLDSRAIEFSQGSRAQTRPAEEEDAKCFAK
ncbi:MAG: hypothetical protein ABSD47_14385 [Candidatus Methylomirabilota bacterium]